MKIIENFYESRIFLKHTGLYALEFLILNVFNIALDAMKLFPGCHAYGFEEINSWLNCYSAYAVIVHRAVVGQACGVYQRTILSLQCTCFMLLSFLLPITVRENYVNWLICLWFLQIDIFNTSGPTSQQKKKEKTELIEIDKNSESFFIEITLRWNHDFQQHHLNQGYLVKCFIYSRYIHTMRSA